MRLLDKNAIAELQASLASQVDETIAIAAAASLARAAVQGKLSDSKAVLTVGTKDLMAADRLLSEHQASETNAKHLAETRKVELNSMREAQRGVEGEVTKQFALLKGQIDAAVSQRTAEAKAAEEELHSANTMKNDAAIKAASADTAASTAETEKNKKEAESKAAKNSLNEAIAAKNAIIGELANPPNPKDLIDPEEWAKALAKGGLNGLKEEVLNGWKKGREIALQEAENLRNTRDAAFKAAETAYTTAKTAYDKAKEEVVKASEEVKKTADAAAAKATSLNVKQELLRLRNRTIDELVKTPATLLEMISKVGTEGEKALRPLAERLKSSVESVKIASDAFEEAHTQYQAAVKTVEESKIVKDVKREAVSARQQVVTETQQAVDKAGAELRNARDEIKKAVDLLTNEEIIPYDIASTLDFALNSHTSGFYANLEFDCSGMSWDSEKTKDLLKGQISLPTIEPLQLAAASFGTKLEIDSAAYYMKRDAEVRPKAEADRVRVDSRTYYASKRFVDWASSDRPVSLIASSIADGGNTASNEIRQQLLLEYQNIASWFMLIGHELKPEVAAQVILSILTREPLTVPGVKIEFHTVQYSPVPDITFGKSLLPKPLREKAEQAFKGFVKKIEDEANKRGSKLAVPHLSFTITIDGLPTAAFEDGVRGFESRIGKAKSLTRAGAAEVFALVAERVDGKAVKDVLKKMSSIMISGGMDESLLVDRLQQSLGIKSAELEKHYVPGQRFIDLTGTEFANRAAGFFSKCAMGNKGSASLERLELDLTTMELSGRARVHHKHSWGSLKDVLGRL